LKTIRLYSDGDLLGDSLCCLPAIYTLAIKQNAQGGRTVLYCKNKEVQKLIPPEIPLEYGDGEPAEYDHMINANNAWQAGVHTMHMMQAHFKYLELPIPEPANMKPELYFERRTMPLKYQFDYIISPYSWSDDKNNKLIPLENWKIVINYLHAKGYTIGVLGTSHDYNNASVKFDNVKYIIQQNLSEVANYILNAKRAVLSIDNGISHLTHILGQKHLLFYPECLPEKWVKNFNDNAIVVRDQPVNFNAGLMIQILEAEKI